MYAFLLRCSSLLLLGIFGGESSRIVDTFVSRKGIRGDGYQTIAVSRNDRVPLLTTLLSSRGGGIDRTTRRRKLLSSPHKEHGKRPSGTETARTAKAMTSNLPSKFTKSPEQETFIENVLRSNFIFQQLSSSEPDADEYRKKKDTDILEVVAAFEEVAFPEGSYLCKQGDLDDTDYLYIVYEGDCSVSIDGKRLEEPYGTMKKGSLVGELAIIYDTARAATIMAITPIRVFRLHRDSYHYFTTISSSSSEGSTPVSPQEILQDELKEIDNAIDQIAGVKSKYGGAIIPRFKPERKWLWSRWSGTILQQAWRPACWNMLLSVVFVAIIRFVCNNVIDKPITWPIGMIPDKSHCFVSRILGFSILWQKLTGLVTFVLTFFLSEAYSLWKDIYNKGRQIQGYLSDISMTVASRAERDPKTHRYTPQASKALDDIAGYIRLFNALSWASLAKKFEVLLTPKAMNRMMSRGIMTRAQYETLMSVPPSTAGPQEITLQWIYIRLMKGIEDGVFPETETMEGVLTESVLGLRKVTNGIRSRLNAKVPLAYAHFVQFLVDFFLLMAPFGLYPELGIWSIPAVGLLNIFYGGLLDLSKILMFPLENDESFYQNNSVNMDVGVMIRQSNVWSSRWKSSVETLPF